MRHVMPFWPYVLLVLSAVRALCFDFIIFPPYEQRGVGGGRGGLSDFLFLFDFPVQTTSGIGHREK